MKKIIVFFVLLVLMPMAFGHDDQELEAGKNLVDSNVECGTLNDEQLEAIGEYYMEQMHPGEAHEIMDQMMGGEGTETLKQVHIRMAKSLYCGEYDMMSGGMMNMMGGYGMMGNGMMNNKFGSSSTGGGYKMGYGMMGNFGYGMMTGYGVGNWFLWVLYSLLSVAVVAFVFGLVFWWTKGLFEKKKSKR